MGRVDAKGRQFEIELLGCKLQEVVDFAESGALDALLKKHGAARVSEILSGDECHYETMSRVPRRSVASTRCIDSEELGAHIVRADVLILTATATEREAVLSFIHPWPSSDYILQGSLGSRSYYLGRLGDYPVALTSSVMGSGGRQGSTITALKAIEDVNALAVVLIGIAFGMDRAKQRLGDVIVAESIFPYELQRVGESCSIHRGVEMPCGIVLSNRFRERSRGWKVDGGTRPVRVQQGLMLSGEKLVDNRQFRDELRHDFPTALGGEMEGAGAYASAAEAKVEMILVKAICDWADGHKNDRAHPFAAYTAASLVSHVLSQRDVLDGIVSTSTPSGSMGAGAVAPQCEGIGTKWETLRRLTAELYETGPRERNVWQRAGGDLSRVEVYVDGRTAWDTAVRMLEKGGGGTNIERIVAAMLEDYPENESLRLLFRSLKQAT